MTRSRNATSATVAISVESIPSKAADWSAANAASPVTYARSPAAPGADTLRRTAATSATTVSVASSLRPDRRELRRLILGASALIGLDCGGVIGGQLAARELDRR